MPQVVGELSSARRGSPRVPGERAQHYAPVDAADDRALREIEAQADASLARRRRVAVLAQRLPLRAQST